MATPSVLTVPSMYGDGILYSGPTVFGPEIVTQFNGVPDGTDVATLTGWDAYNTAVSRNIINQKLVIVTSGGNQGAKFTATTIVGRRYLFKASATGDLGAGGIYINSGSGVNVNLNTGDTRLQLSFTADSTTTTLFFRASSNAAGTTTYSNITLKEEIQRSDFESTRSTTGTRINEDGYIEDVPYNLVTQSEIFSSGWSKNNTTLTIKNVVAPNQSFTGCLLQGSTVNNRHNVARTSVSDTQTATLSVFVKKKELRYVQIASANNSNQHANFDVQNAVIGNVGAGFSNAKIESAGNEWYRLSVVSSNQYNSFYISLISGLTSPWLETWAMPNNTDGLYIWGAQLVKGDQPKNYLPTTDRLNLPRLNYPVYGGCPSLLVEPQRTNEVTHSQDFTNGSWNKSFGITITSNQAISPEGIQNADKLIIDNGTFTLNGGLYIQRIGVVNQDVSFSVFAKAGGFRYGTISYGSSNANGFHFDLEDGIILSTFTNTSNYINIGYEMIAYPNGWYKLVVNTTEKIANNRFIGIRPNNTIPTSTNNNYSSTGDGSSGIFVYGAQLEVGSYSTSLIHTSGSTVTRNEDKAINAGLETTDTFNDDEGVLFIETEALVNNAEARAISINAGNGQNRVLITYPNTASSRITGFIQTTAGGGLNANIDGIDTTQKHKVAVKYKLNNCAVFIDGVKRTQANSVAMPVGLDRLHFSNGVTANAAEYRGNLNAIAVYKTALTDTELANLTSYNNHDLFIPYRSRMQMINADQELQCTEHDITRFL